MNVREAYEKSLQREGHDRDSAQEKLVELLEDLQQRLQVISPSGWWRRFTRSRGGAVPDRQGLYIWGGVGRGKTFLMDLFFETLPIQEKRRSHFHRMMRDVHERLGALDDIEDPLDQVAAEIARDARVLCFDEFFVSDIGDAMILARLLDGLFRRGVTLVATSNSQPDALYPDGLQRQRFLPAISLLKAHTQVVHLDGDLDYRLRLLQQAGTYLTPNDVTTRNKLEHFFDESASSQVTRERQLNINGRAMRAFRCAKGIAWFTFNDICDGPRSQNDYIEIARWYPTVIVSDIPILDHSLENQARRFIALVDEFYDRRVKLIVSADAEVNTLYTGSRLAFEFERTVSRLIEMQSAEYLHAPHLA